MNTIASVGRLYRLKLAQQATEKKRSSYLTSQFVEAAIESAKKISPFIEKFYQLSMDKDTFINNKGKYSAEWSDLLSRLMAFFSVWQQQVNANQNQIDTNNQAILSFNAAGAFLSTINLIYSQPITKTEQTYSSAANWMIKNIGNYVSALNVVAQNKKSDPATELDYYKENYHNNWIESAQTGIDKWMDYLKQSQVEESDEQFSICNAMIQQLKQSEDLFEAAQDATKKALEIKNQPNYALTLNLAKQAWAKVFALTSEIVKNKDKLINKQVAVSEESGENINILEKKYTEITNNVKSFKEFLNYIPTLTANFSPMSFEESIYQDYEAGADL